MSKSEISPPKPCELVAPMQWVIEYDNSKAITELCQSYVIQRLPAKIQQCLGRRQTCLA